MVEGGLGGGGGKYVGRKVRKQILGYVDGVVGAPARVASFDGDAGFGVLSGKVGTQVEGEWLVV